MYKPFDAIPIAVRIGLAALIGCMCGFAFFLTRGFTKLPSILPPEQDWSFSTISQSMLFLLFFMFLAFMLMAPLICIAIVAGIFLRHRIEKRPILWSVGSALSVWTLAILSMEFTGDPSEWQRAHTLLDRTQHAFMSLESALFLTGALSAGFSFYLSGVINQRVRK